MGCLWERTIVLYESKKEIASKVRNVNKKNKIKTKTSLFFCLSIRLKNKQHLVVINFRNFFFLLHDFLICIEIFGMNIGKNK